MARSHVRRLKPMSEINVVPYIDVMLVLLVIFMVTAPLLQQGVEVALPEAPSKPLEEGSRDNEPLVVTVDAEGRMSMNKGQTPNEPVDADLLTTEVRGLLIEQPTLPVYVRGDRNVAYDYVIQALVVLQSAGADGVGLITDPPPKQRGGG